MARSGRRRSSWRKHPAVRRGLGGPGLDWPGPGHRARARERVRRGVATQCRAPRTGANLNGSVWTTLMTRSSRNGHPGPGDDPVGPGERVVSHKEHYQHTAITLQAGIAEATAQIVAAGQKSALDTTGPEAVQRRVASGSSQADAPPSARVLWAQPAEPGRQYDRVPCAPGERRMLRRRV